MELKILNKPELDKWLNERRAKGCAVVSIKGTAPEGATYSDGDPITRPVNVAWKDCSTGEVFGIDYKTQ